MVKIFDFHEKNGTENYVEINLVFYAAIKLKVALTEMPLTKMRECVSALT